MAGEPVAVTSRGGLHPSISPDGEWLAFDHSFGTPDSINIGIIRTDGSGRRQLTRGRFREWYPTWSPDGTGIAFHSNRSGTLEIWSINVDGGGLEQLTGEIYFERFRREADIWLLTLDARE